MSETTIIPPQQPLNGRASIENSQVSVGPVVNTKPEADMELIKDDRPTEMFHSYDQGIMDGMLMVNPEPFGKFIDAYHYREYKNKAVYFLRGQIKELLTKQAEAKGKIDGLLTEKMNAEAETAALTFKLDYVSKLQLYWKSRIDEAKANLASIKDIKTDYTLLAAMVFFFFALIFIGADYTICLSIVANALKIGLEKGVVTNTAKVFAFAMSGLSIALKPAYDRLVEKPYHHSANKKRFAMTILIIAGIILGMLLALGVFRERVIEYDAKLGEILNSTSEDGSIPQLPKFEVGTAGLIGVILSTVLFAIAGAICLGISLPILHKNFRNFWNFFARKRWHKREHKLFEEQAMLEGSKASKELQVKRLDEQIAALTKDKEVDELIDEKKNYIQLYQHGEMVKNIEKSMSLYLTGVERGEKMIGKVPEEWLHDKLYSLQSTPMDKSGNGMLPIAPSKEKQAIGKRTRPFVALRRMISHDSKKKWSEEKDINIEVYNFD